MIFLSQWGLRAIYATKPIDINNDGFTDLNINLIGNFEDATFTATPSNDSEPAYTIIQYTRDEPELSISPASISHPEGDSGITAYTYVVTRTGNLNVETEVTYTLNGGGVAGLASADAQDFDPSQLPQSNVLVFPAINPDNPSESSSKQTITINVKGDTDQNESDEGFTVTLSDPVNGVLATGQDKAEGIIEDDDNILPQVSIEAVDAIKREGNSGATDFWFRVKLDQPTNEAVSVNWTVNSGQADAIDFGGSTVNDPLPHGTATVPANQDHWDFSIPVSGDTDVEPNEFFTVTISNPTNARLDADSAYGFIVDDDGAPKVFIVPDNSYGDEGNSGTQPFTFKTVLSGAVTSDVSVGYALSDSSQATADDFSSSTGLVKFFYDPQTGTVDNYIKPAVVQVSGDTLLEPDEAFQVLLQQPAGATIDLQAGLGVIYNDDDPFGFSITPQNATDDEGNVGQVKEFTFQVKRTGNLVAGSVDFAVFGDGSATSADVNADFVGAYVANSNVSFGSALQGTIPFAEGVDTQTVVIKVKGDNTPEPDEGFKVELSNPTGTNNIVTDKAYGTILDDDTNQVSIAATDANRDEEDAGGTPFRFMITLNRPQGSGGDVTVNWSVMGAGATPDDFSGGSYPNGSWTFLATQETTQTHEVVVFVQGDTAPEYDEGFIVKLDQPQLTTVNLGNSQANGSIRDDDTTTYTMSSSVSRGEGTNIAPVPFKFVVNRSGNVDNAVDLSFSVTPSGSNPATDDGLPTGGIVHFAAGETKSYALVNVNPDSAPEPNETFTVSLSVPPTPNDPTPQPLAAVGTIINDDVALPPWPRPVFRGDPHLITFDGLAYDFQAAGEFVLVKGAENSGILIQARTVPFGDAVSNITAIAALIDGHRVSFDSRSESFLRIDGVPTQISEESGFVTVGNATITFDGSSYTVLDPGRVSFIVQDFGERLDVTLSSDELLVGKLQGLLGNYNNDTTDDLAMANGTVLAQPLAFADLYGQFADAWRVTADNSLFDYANGESTETYTDRSFPKVAVTLDMLPEDLVAKATALVDEAGITDPVVRAAAILDVALTGDLSFLASAAIPVEPLATVQLTDLPDALPILSVGTVDDAQLEGNDGLTWYQFNIYRTGSTQGALEVSYQVIGTGEHPVDAFDFGGTIPYGFVHFADGQASVPLALAVLGDVAAEFDEHFALKIDVADTDSASVLIAAPSATATIINDDALPPARLDVRVVNGEVVEGHSGSQTVTFEVLRSENFASNISVGYTIAGSGERSVAADDFVSDTFPSGSLNFSAGEIRKLITVEIAGDPSPEFHESFKLQLHNPSNNAYLGIAASDVTIINDDFSSIDIGNAAVRLLRSDAGAWERSWTNGHISISHKADINDANEAYSDVLFTNAGSGVLNGGDISGGDLGVSGQTLATSAVKPEIDGTEGLRFLLDEEATGVEFNLSRFFANDEGTDLNEAGRVMFFNPAHELVKTVDFAANSLLGERHLSIDVPEGFNELVFTAGASNGEDFIFGGYGNATGDGFGGASAGGHGSDYLVDAISFEFGEVAVVGSSLPTNPLDPFTVS